MPTANHPGGQGTKGGSFRGPEMLPAVAGERFDGSQTRHGTTAGHKKHLTDGSDPCEMCRIAKSQYDRNRLDVPENVQRNRLHAKAQAQALQMLRRRHEDEYRELYTAQKQELFKEAGIEVKSHQSFKRVNQTTWS